jgi:hypothetical protein
LSDVLEKELQVYKLRKKELLGKAKGKFVLIKGDEIIGVFESQIDAINHGYEKYGNTPLLVKEILEFEIPRTLSSSLLKI